MQHDTTIYMLEVGKKRIKVVASIIYFRYSKIRYLKFYRSFNRFQMKCFLHEALMFYGYAAPECIIDNTNLARLSGTGSRAVIIMNVLIYLSKRVLIYLSAIAEQVKRGQIAHIDKVLIYLTAIAKLQVDLTLLKQRHYHSIKDPCLRITINSALNLTFSEWGKILAQSELV